MKPKTLLIILLLFVSGYFRLYKLNQNPPALFSDEVDAGYQAYIFNQCQSDYHGRFLPTHFKSFSDYRTPIMIYAMSLSQKIFGVSDFSIRVVPVFFGLITCFLIYLLTKQINPNKNNLFSLFLAGISPWLIHYSRVGFEVTIMLSFLLSGLFFWLKYVQKQKASFLFLSSLFFILSTYSYSTAKLFIVLLAIPLFIIYKKSILKIPAKTFIPLFLFSLALISPMLIDTLKSQSGYRFSYINIFTDPTTQKTVNYLRQLSSISDQGLQIGLSPSFFSRLTTNKVTLTAQTFLKNYLSSFSTNFLFLSGDNNLRHGFGQRGLMLYPDFILIIFGLTALRKIKKKHRQLIILWLLISPIPFALTRDSSGPHATRLILLLPIFISIVTIGFSHIKSKILAVTVIVIYLFSFFDFHYFYYHIYPHNSANQWHVGIKESVQASQGLTYDHIFFSQQPESFLPFFLYYQKVIPADCNIENSLVWDNKKFFTGRKLNDKFYFGQIDWSQIDPKQHQNDLFVISQTELPTIQSQHSITIKQKIETKFEMSVPYIIFSIDV